MSWYSAPAPPDPPLRDRNGFSRRSRGKSIARSLLGDLPMLRPCLPFAGQSSIDCLTTEIRTELVALRRAIHRSPELPAESTKPPSWSPTSWEPPGYGYTKRVGGHGVIAILDGARVGATIAYRAELDAVAGDELLATDFASRVPGVAHSCGHDLHATIAVGIAEVLSRIRDRLPGRIAFIFQPAEESLTGAQAMIDDRVLAPAPREIYALHCAPLPTGEIAVLPGTGLPGLDRFQIELTGTDPVAAGQRLVAEIADLSTVHYPRTAEEFGHLLDALRVARGPLERFVVASASTRLVASGVALTGYVRAWPDDRYPEIRASLRELVGRHDDATITWPDPPFPAMICSGELSESAAQHLRSALGPTAVPALHAAFPFNSEDFALFLRRVPGAMFFLGVVAPVRTSPPESLTCRPSTPTSRRSRWGYAHVQPALVAPHRLSSTIAGRFRPGPAGQPRFIRRPPPPSSR